MTYATTGDRSIVLAKQIAPQAVPHLPLIKRPARAVPTMPIPGANLHKDAKPPRVPKKGKRAKPQNPPKAKPRPPETRSQNVDPKTRRPPIPTIAGRAVAKPPSTHVPTAARQGPRQLQPQPSHTPGPKDSGFFKNLFSSCKASCPVPAPRGTRVHSGSQNGQ